MIQEAVQLRASDIHVEPFEDRVRIRYRIDGVLHERDRLPKRQLGAIISRIKILASIDIAEKRREQDGRIKVSAGESRSFQPITGNLASLGCWTKTISKSGSGNSDSQKRTTKSSISSFDGQMGLCWLQGIARSLLLRTQSSTTSLGSIRLR